MNRSPLIMLAFLALLWIPDSHAQRLRNPFGKRSGSLSGFNMGMLGGECKELGQTESRALGLNSGQTSLQVTQLNSGQLGQRSGLVIGDQIVDIAGRVISDKQTGVYQLARAMDRALCARRGATLVLGVLRGGRAVKVTVKMPGLGPHATSCPKRCRHCAALLKKSFDFVLGRQKEDGSFPTLVGGNNGMVATTAITGLALLAASAKPSGAMASAIGKAKDFLVKTVGKESTFGGLGGRGSGADMGGQLQGAGGGGNWSQVNWSLGYGALFLSEYLARTGDAAVRQKLVWVCRQIEANQEANGGWSHGPGGANALGYTDFAAVTNVVLSGYGAAGRVKIKLQPKTVSKAINYLVGTAAADGGIGYSQRSGQKGHGDAGRTGGSVLAFGLCRQNRHPFFGKMVGYFTKNMDQVPEGHASAVHHFGMASLACFQLSGAWKRFNEHFRYELVSARNPDGSFTPRPSSESASMGINSDRTTGPCWATGTYLLAWNLPRGNLLIYTGKGRR